VGAQFASDDRNQALSHGTQRNKQENEDKELVNLPRDFKRREDRQRRRSRRRRGSGGRWRSDHGQQCWSEGGEQRSGTR
jgi:hypothetical protein